MVSTRSASAHGGVMARWRQYMDDVDDATPQVTIGEGNTPLLEAHRLGELLGVQLYLKLELANPTGSFKDRGMCVAVARAMQDGAHTLVCASTGNTSASAAAFAAAAGLRCAVVVPSGKIAAGKLMQAQIAGAKVIAVDASFDVALDIVRELAQRDGYALVNSVNPARIQGQKTAAFELCSALGEQPLDWLSLPVGNAGNITAYWLGLREAHEHGWCSTLPQIIGVQAAGAAPLVDGHPVEHPETIATAIRIGRPARGDQALAAIAESNGRLYKQSDAEIITAYRLVARTAGIFCEPASAASIAGLIAAIEDGTVSKGSAVACVLTGHGLKDPDIAQTDVTAPTHCAPTAAAVMAAVDGDQPGSSAP